MTRHADHAGQIIAAACQDRATAKTIIWRRAGIAELATAKAHPGERTLIIIGNHNRPQRQTHPASTPSALPDTRRLSMPGASSWSGTDRPIRAHGRAGARSGALVGGDQFAPAEYVTAGA